MVIQHNIAAINSYRNLGINQGSLNKNLEKLSSGYKINRAGDNAAGLAISESMRSQINGLNQASANANDAIGLIQTAEGALTEVHSMLQRMTTLATQAANGTYNSVARGNIQSEMDELIAEIDRVANNTDFNGIKPLSSKNGIDGSNAALTRPTKTDPNGEVHKLTFQIGPTGGETITMNGQTMTTSGIFTEAGWTADSKTPAVDENGNPVNAGLEATKGANNTKSVLHVGTTTTTYANRAISAIKTAIDSVSSYRAKLGAAQNRLEHTINNLEVTSENITAAESRIRDTDMADEITAYTKNNILLQAAQSMLSQANAAPQGVLSLLQ